MAKKFVPNNNDFAIAYYRFSSHAQSDASIQQQRDAAEKYAAGHGLKIIKEYKDEAISGTTDQRPGFQLLLAEIGKIKPGALIIWKTDRLGRDRYDLAIAKKYIRDAGCIIHYIAEPITGDAPESALMEGVLESMAEYYSRQLRTNIKRGHLYNAQNCLYNGHKTLGYATEPAPEFGKNRQRYVIDPVTAPFVRKIFEDYAAGKTMVDIAKELNGLGMTTGRGKPFTVNSLAHTLNNRAYIGEYRYGDIVTPGGMPAIVSQEVFEAAKKRLIQNKRQGGQRANGLAPDETPRFWLTGKLYCGKCGTRMQGTSGTSEHQGRRHYYYICGAAKKHQCSLKRVRKDKIEGIVCFMLSQCLKDTGMLASLAADVAAYYQKEHEDKGYIQGLKAERAETEKALNNLVRAIEQGIFSETTQKRLTELESRKKALMEAIEAEEIKRAVTKNEISIQHFFDEYKNADLDDPTVRDYLLDYFVDKIFVYDDKIVLTSWYGDNKTEITWVDVDRVVVKERKRKRRKSSTASELVPPSGTGKARFDESQNELFLFPPCRLIYPMNAIIHSPSIQAKALQPNIQEKARFYIALFLCSKGGFTMPEIILSDYFYGDESEEFIYFKIPRLLITDQKFKHVSTDAKLLYGMLLDRMGLSAKNNWYDDYGRVYIYYTVDEICEDMCCGRDKAMKLLAELDKKKGIGLVERVKQGQGRPTKLYVKRFTTRTVPKNPASPPPESFTPCSEVDFIDPQTSEKSTSRGRKNRP